MRPALDLLRDWDRTQPANSAPAAFFNATWRHLLARTFDELPKEQKPDGGARWFEVVRNLLAVPDSPWWDDQDTAAKEQRDDVLRDAMTDASDELTKRLGKDVSDWRWGDLHTLELRNQSFGESGIGPIEWLFNRGPYAAAGGDSIVNATGWTAPDGYGVDWVPSMRMVVDLDDLDRSRWVNLTGTSGHAFHRYYTDQIEHWQLGETTPMRWDRPGIEEQVSAPARTGPVARRQVFAGGHMPVLSLAAAVESVGAAHRTVIAGCGHEQRHSGGGLRVTPARCDRHRADHRDARRHLRGRLRGSAGRRVPEPEPVSRTAGRAPASRGIRAGHRADVRYGHRVHVRLRAASAHELVERLRG